MSPARAGATVATVLAALLITVLPARAMNSDDVAAPRLKYRCELEATKLEGTITLTLRLRTDDPREGWAIKFLHDGERMYRRVRHTNALGDLRVVRREPNLPGRDRFLARARHLETAGVCVVETRI